MSLRIFVCFCLVFAAHRKHVVNFRSSIFVELVTDKNKSGNSNSHFVLVTYESDNPISKLPTHFN